MAASSSLQSNHWLDEIYRSHSERFRTSSSEILVAGTVAMTGRAARAPSFSGAVAEKSSGVLRLL